MRFVSIGAGVALVMTAAFALAQDNPTSGVHSAIYPTPPGWRSVAPPSDMRATGSIRAGAPRVRAQRHMRRG